MRAFFVLLAVAATLSACVTVPLNRVYNARMYNLSTGEIIVAVERNDRDRHGFITAGPTKSGETFSGEATTIDNRTKSSGYGAGRVSNPGIFTDSYISTSSYSTATPGYENGSAILVGTQGTVIDVLYRVSFSGMGDGEGLDNKGIKYRIQFSQQR